MKTLTFRITWASAALALFILTISVGLSYGQTHGLQSGYVVLEDGSGHTLTLEPSTMTSNQIFTFPATTAYTPGSVFFADGTGAINQDNAKFFWDNTNWRLGIGNSAPAYALDVTGSGNFTGALTLGTPLAIAQGGTGLNAAPASGQILVGNAGGTAYALQTVGGDATLSNTGSLTVTKTNGSAFGTMATQDATGVTITGGSVNGATLGDSGSPDAGTLNSLVLTGRLFYSLNETDNATAGNTVVISGNYMLASVNVGLATANITALVSTSIAAGQVLYIWNNNGSGYTVTLDGYAIPDGAVAQFMYLGGSWRHVQ